MSHTNQTPNYHLPQFIGTDKPAWLVDFNQAMSDIDTQMKANATASATAEANAQSALSGLSATNTQVSSLQTDVSAIQTQLPLDEAQIATNSQNISTQASAIVNANNRIDTANSNITALNTKVGDLADLDTTDKTSVVNAVNELNAEISDLVKTSLGTEYDLTLNTPYTATSHGYLFLGCTNNAESKVNVTVGGQGFYVNGSTAGYTQIPLWVNKGMTLTMTASTNGWAKFYPLV